MPSITVGATTLDIVDYDAARKTMSFFNASTGGQILYVTKAKQGGIVAGNSEYPIPPNSGLDFDIFNDGLDIQGAWCAVASAAGGILYYASTSTRRGEPDGRRV